MKFPIKRKLTVTQETDIEIEITEEMLVGYTVEEYLKLFNEGLWKVDGMDDVIKYAAKVAATGGSGYDHDGIGLVIPSHDKERTKAGVYFYEISTDISAEFID